MRKVLAVLVCGVLVAGLLSCGSGQPGAGGAGGGKKQYTIAVIPKGTTHIFWKSVHDGALQAGAEFGCEILWQGPERETDREKQIQIIEDYMIQKVSAFVLAPLDKKALVPSVEKLSAQKIPCAIIDSGIDTDKYTTFAATDNYQGGVMAAKRMGEILGGKGKIVVVKYTPGSGSTTDRENGFMDTIKKDFTGITIVDDKFGQDTVETALQATEDLLTKNADLQGLYACNASTSVGALQALQTRKRTEVKMIGFDAEAALVNALKAGQIDSLIVQDPKKMGYEGVKAVVAALKGETPPKKIDTGVKLVTKGIMSDPEVEQLLRTQ